MFAGLATYAFDARGAERGVEAWQLDALSAFVFLDEGPPGDDPQFEWLTRAILQTLSPDNARAQGGPRWT